MSTGPGSSTKSTLQYGSLDPAKREIRLLSLVKDTNEWVVQCTLERISLDAANKPPYIALSYMWGPTTVKNLDRIKVFVERQPFVPTPNLLIALVYLKATEPEGTKFWVDAICINQNDHGERDKQVRIMPAIYASARMVYAWMTPTQESQVAVSHINSMARKISKCPIGRIPDLADLTSTRAWLQSLGSVSFWKSFRALLEQPYWKRAWIVQELKFARQVKIISGTSIADFDALFRVLQNVMNAQASYNLRDAIPEGVIMNILYPWSVCKLCFSSRTQPLSSLLNDFGFTSATDPRDKIYSLLGIATQGANHSFPIDYTMPWSAVFKAAVKYIIENEGNMSIIADAASATQDLPSWVPDWTTQHALAYTGGLNQHHHDRTVTNLKLSAGGRTPGGVMFSHDNSRLTTAAILIGAVPWILPQKHFGSILPPLEELSRRLRFLQVPYMDDLTALTLDQPSANFYTILTMVLALQLYEATFKSHSTYDTILNAWSAQDFANLCADCIGGRAREDSLTPARLEALRIGLEATRSLFFCPLPPQHFSLAEYVKKHMVRGVDAATLDTLKKMPKLYAAGYCRNQEDWGQNGDFVTVIPGCRTCLLLRPTPTPEGGPLLGRVISEAYVCGLMEGEALSVIQQTSVTLI